MPKGVHIDADAIPPKQCARCGKEFRYVKGRTLAAWEGRRFCSRRCFDRSGADGFKRDPETRARMSANRTGKLVAEEHHQWKGDEAGYGAVHGFVARRKKRQHRCSACGAEGRTHWHNIDGRYSRELDDWIELCARCNKRAEVRMRACPHCGKLLFDPRGEAVRTPTFARSRRRSR